MQFIGIIIALLMVGFLMIFHVEPDTEKTTTNKTTTEQRTPPKVTQNPNDVPVFEQQMNEFVDQQNAEREQYLNDITQ